MKHLYKTLGGALMLAICGMNATAQQLPNTGFENWKTVCGSTEAFGKGGLTSPAAGEMRQRPGVEPTDWHGSSINQKVIMSKTQQLIYKDADANGGTAVKMANTFVGVGSIGSVAPGFINLGTPWVYAISDIDECAGGVYGGVAFTATPDAITGQYKRSDSTGENSHIIVYLWNGTFKSNVGSASAPSQERENVDRAILGKTTTTGGDGKLVAYCDYTFTSTNSGWQTITVPIEYVDGAGAPTMMNTIVSAGDYWTRPDMVDGTTLYANDVKLVYYSRLSGLSVNGVAVDGFADDVYNYTMSGTELPAEDEIEATVMGRSAVKSVAIDNEEATVTITVTNVDADIDGQSSHSYILQYEKAPAKQGEATDYPGYLNIDMMTEDGLTNIAEDDPAAITITDYNDGTCDFLLPELVINLDGMELPLGDIKVEGATVVKNDDGSANYTGTVEKMLLLEGALMADVNLNGTISDAGVVNMKIDVIWIQDESDRSLDVPIYVTFTTNKVSGINSISTVSCNGNAPVDVYTITGVKVMSNVNAAEAVKSLDKGFYIMGNKKVVIR